MAAIEEAELRRLVDETIRRAAGPEARVESVEKLPPGPQGYSGAPIRYYRAGLTRAGGEETVDMVVKEAPLVERLVLARLVAQGHALVPVSHALDLSTDAPLPICQLYAEGEGLDAPGFTQLFAEELAALHVASLGRGAELPWLPRADRAYFETFILANYREAIAALRDASDFRESYGPQIALLEEAAGRLLAEQEQLWAEGDALTLIHADIGPDHILSSRARPRLIDWGQARYGSLYLDLPNAFTPESVEPYRAALAALGHEIPRERFMERYRQAGRYLGFKYMSFALGQWARGGETREQWSWFLDFTMRSAIEGRTA